MLVPKGCGITVVSGFPIPIDICALLDHVNKLLIGIFAQD